MKPRGDVEIWNYHYYVWYGDAEYRRVTRRSAHEDIGTREMPRAFMVS